MPKYVVKNGDKGIVLLNGLPVKGVFECDTDEGYIIRGIRDKETGYFIFNDLELITERLTGTVTFEAIIKC